jgi:3-oxoacyl-[acyl-carrier-protein] synthase I
MTMSRPRAVYVNGLGLSCALGRGMDACMRSLALGTVRTVPLALDGYSEPVRMPYYALPGEETLLFDTGRFLRLLPEAAAEALDQAGLGREARRRLPLFVGSTGFGVSRAEGEYLELLVREPGSSFALPRVGFQEVRERLDETLGVGGPDYVFNTACTASANALLAAQRLISLGRMDQALVLGLEFANRTTLTGFSGLQLLSPELKPFDAGRDGIVLGEGLGAALLSAEPGGLGLALAGGASNCDTYSVTSASPDGGSIAALLRKVLAQTGLAPDQVRGVKAHGTASPQNDSSEAAGLRGIFDAMPPLCALKPYLGHTLGACGSIELALFGGAVSRGFLPPVPGFRRADPALGVRPLTVEAPAPGGHYLLNYFGFGGNNTVLALEKRA